MKRCVEWVINYKKRIDNSLTAKNFIMQLFILITICTTVYGLFMLFLPITNEKRSRSELDKLSKDLISELRLSTAPESGALFARFIRDTGADLKLLKGNDVTAEEQAEGLRYPFRFADSDVEYILLVKYNSVRSDQIFQSIWQSLPWVIGLIFILSFFGALFHSRYTAQPIIRMSKIAEKIAALDFSWYCPDLRTDEIGKLAISLNELSDKLNAALSTLRLQNSWLEDEIALEKEREHRRMLFFSAVSHEFKTPIAIVLGQLEGMQAGIGVYKDRDKYLARSAEILQSLDGLIREVLSVSQIELAGGENGKPLDLSEIVEDTIRERVPLIKSRSLMLVTEIEKGVVVSGESALLQKALSNAIGNAASYSPDGATVSIRLSKSSREATLEIINSHVKIAEEHLPHLFDAFFRADRNAEPGSGLGLYITRMILDAHKVYHTIENTIDGVKFTAVFKNSNSGKKHNNFSQTP